MVCPRPLSSKPLDDMNDALQKTGWIALGVPALPALLLGGMLLSESIRIAVASPDAVAAYHFGSEAMVGHGGWRYRSRWAYAASSAASGVPFLGMGALLIWVLMRRRDSASWLAAGAIAFLVGASAAALATLAAWQHNPQSEFHSVSSVNWDGLIVIAVTWFATVYAIVLLLTRVIAGSLRRAGRVV